MAVFTRIPETAIAGVLGTAVGAAAGVALSAALSSIGKLQEQINQLQEELQEGNTSHCSSISSMEDTLNNLEKTLTSVQKSTADIGKVATIMAATATALQAAVLIIKTLPVPQQYMVVSFTVLQSDTLELLMEKIAQIGEVSAGIAGVTAGIDLALSPAMSSIKSMRQSLTTAIVSCALGEEDTNQTNGQGSSSDLSTLVAQLSKIVSDEIKRLGYLVDLQSGVDDIHTALVESLIDAIEPGNYVDIPKDTGDWIATVYRVSQERPDKPLSRTVPPVGWSENEPKGQSWKSIANISGKSGLISTPWSRPVLHSGSGMSVSENEQYSTLVRKWDYNMIYPVKDKTAITGSILYLENSDQAYELLQGILNNLDSEVVSDDLKDKIAEVFATGDSEGDQPNVKIVTINNIRFRLEIKNDPNSPSIAVARYVQANKVDSGELVAVSNSSFTKDNEVLFKNMELTLTQMFV